MSVSPGNPILLFLAINYFCLPTAALANWKAQNFDAYAVANVMDSSQSNGINIVFGKQDCDEPVLQVIDLVSNPNVITEGTTVTAKIRVDWIDPWDAAFTVTKADMRDKTFVTFVQSINGQFVGELVSGKNLRIKIGDLILKWSLQGSAQALSTAYQYCIQAAEEEKKYFPPTQSPGFDDDDKYF